MSKGLFEDSKEQKPEKEQVQNNYNSEQVKLYGELPRETPKLESSSVCDLNIEEFRNSLSIEKKTVMKSKIFKIFFEISYYPSLSLEKLEVLASKFKSMTVKEFSTTIVVPELKAKIQFCTNGIIHCTCK